MFDTWVHQLMMGLEEHLIGMFRGDAEFHEDAAPSHLGGHASRAVSTAPGLVVTNGSQILEAAATPAIHPDQITASDTPAIWAPEAEKELRKIPFFVRGKARRNTEHYAQMNSVQVVTIETLYDAKAHFSR